MEVDGRHREISRKCEWKREKAGDFTSHTAKHQGFSAGAGLEGSRVAGSWRRLESSASMDLQRA